MENEVTKTRQKLDMTLQQFANAIGVNINTVWRWEKGRNSPPRSALMAMRSMSNKAPESEESL